MPHDHEYADTSSDVKALVSICIPTCNRPDLLELALRSCVAQTYEPLELVIGDDSANDAARDVVESFRNAREWTIAYRRNSPTLGQNANVNDLFARATGRRLVLLHDDDLLLPGAIEALSAPWRDHPDLALTFGRQELITQDGTLDVSGTEKHNRTYGRTSDTAGLIADSMSAALLLRIPNNGFMIDAATARTLGYRRFEEVGVYCDADFTLRLGASLGPNRIVFVDRAVSQYRANADSISHSGESRRLNHPQAAIALYENLETLGISPKLRREREHFVDHLIVKLVKGYAVSGRRRNALKLFLSKTYGWRRRTSPRGLYHLALIAEPRLDRIRSYG